VHVWCEGLGLVEMKGAVEADELGHSPEHQAMKIS
jgi:hypothetical protein